MDAYNFLIRFGRYLDQGHEFKPEDVLRFVEYMNVNLHWTPISDFFTLFPPIKNHDDDGTWDYKSTNEMINRDFGERFGKDDFKELLMTACYENRFVKQVGLAYMKAIRQISIKKMGTDPLMDFLNGLNK